MHPEVPTGILTQASCNPPNPPTTSPEWGNVVPYLVWLGLGSKSLLRRTKANSNTLRPTGPINVLSYVTACHS